jgi:hypothetical protein
VNERNSFSANRLAGRRRLGVAVGALLGLILLLPAGAETPPDGGKSRYNLFHPTPRDEMREMNTDRPDQTESPYTVDAGHLQVEMDFASGVLDRDRSNGGDMHSQVWSFAPVNLKVGLWNNVDIQFVLDSYVHSRVENDQIGAVEEDSGVGDFVTRLKINFWGNDGGSTAFGLMPFVKWPLPESGLRNGKTEGGVILPLAVELPGGWGMGMMTEFDFVSDDGGGYDTEYLNSVTFSHDIVGKLGGYLEFAALVTPGSDVEWQGQVDVGFTYGVNKNTQFDFGCNFGVTESAPDFNPFVGLSLRF